MEPISIVVPVYNSEGHLGTLARAIDESIASGELPSSEETEVIFVNDASTDSSWDRIVQHTERYGWAHGIDLCSHIGQHAALIVGASAATHAVVVTMDDDLQHPPKEVGKLTKDLQRVKSKGERAISLVYGTPLSRGSFGFRRAGSCVARLGLACRMRSRVALGASAFRAFDVRHVAELAKFDQRSINLDAALVALGAKATAVRVAHGESLRSASSYGVRSLLRAAGAVFMGPRTRRPTMPAAAEGGPQIRARVGFSSDSVGG